MGIRGKLTLPILVAFLVFSGILHYFWAPQQHDFAHKAFMAQMNRGVSAMESDLIRNILTRDYSALYASLDAQLANNDSWINLSLYNGNGKRIYPLFPDDRHVGVNDEFHVLLRRSLNLEGESHGHIEVLLDWHQEYAEAQQRIRELEGFLVVTAFLLLAATLISQNYIIRMPILKLKNAADKMAMGDFTSQLPVARKDEIGTLIHAFDDMRAETISALISANMELHEAHGETKEALNEVTEKNVELHDEVIERKKAEAKLHDMAMHDNLTKLPNRVRLKEEANKLISAARRTGDCVAFMFVDLDGFKTVNDNHKHETGDLVLVEMASRLKSAVRDIDTVGRFGGDEFVIVLPGYKNESELDAIARRILAEIKKPVELKGVDESLSVSIGIAIYPDNATTSDELISLADKAMYQAKESGKDQYVIAA